MKFKEFKIINESQFNSKQEVIDHFVKQGKSAAAGASAWERGWRGHTPKKKELKPPPRSYHDDLDDKRYGETNEDNDPCWKGYKQIGMKKKGGKKVPNCVPTNENTTQYQVVCDGTKKGIFADKDAAIANAKSMFKHEKEYYHIAVVDLSNKKEVWSWNKGEDVYEDWQSVNKHDKTDGMSSKAVKAYRRENPGSKLKTAVTKKPSELKAGSKDAKRRKSFCARMSGVEGPMKDEKGRPTAKAKALSRWNCEESIEALEQQLAEAALGIANKRPARKGSRPDRGHEPVPRYKKAELDEHKKGVRAHKYTKKAKGTVDPLDPKKTKEVPGRKVVGPQKIKQLEKALEEAAKTSCQFCGHSDHNSLDESGKASRSLCLSSKPDSELGASQLASCKSQGLRAREGKKSHKIGKTRVTMGGHKIKGKKYGGNIPDWS